MKRMAQFVLVWLALTTAAFAQGRDFSGTWALDTEKTGAAQGPPSLTVAMTKTELSLTMGAKTAQTVTFKLDGSEVSTTQDSTSHVVWRGDVLDIVTKSTDKLKGAPVSSTLSFSRSGAWLVMEGQTPKGTMKLYFKKAQ